MNEINREDVQNILKELHRSAAKDKWRIPRVIIQSHLSLLWGRKPTFTKSYTEKSHVFKDLFFSIDKKEGMILYAVCRLLQSKHIIEFGSSYGVSSMYLMAALIDNGGGKFIGTELDKKKSDYVNKVFGELGWADKGIVFCGDALETLRDIKGKWDLLFLDGWNELYLDVVTLLEDKMDCGGIIIATDVDMFKRKSALCIEYFDKSDSFDTIKLKIGVGGWVIAIKKDVPIG